VYENSPLAPFSDLLAREFPHRGDGVFLNTAAQGILPQRAIHAMAAFERRREYPNRIDDPDLQEVEETCRARVAELVGAPVERVGLAVNTSEGLNLAALQFPLGPGDRVLVQRGDFPANVLPWVARARGGVEVVFLDPHEGGHIDTYDVAGALDRDPRIRAVSLPLVHFATGHRHPIERVAEICRDRGAWLAVDAIQGLGAVPFHAASAGADLVACGGQKWLCAPWGSGFFVVSDRMLETEPSRAGWLQVARARSGAGEYDDLCDYRLTWPVGADRFEVGTYAYTALLGLSESVSLLLEIGVERVAAHARSQLVRVAAVLEERGATLVSCQRDPCRSSILCFRLDDDAATRALHQGLVTAGIACAYRQESIRIAAHLYTTDADLDHLLAAVDEAWPAARAAAR
jgi:selenocysteine lyase/cysteine desulfurase